MKNRLILKFIILIFLILLAGLFSAKMGLERDQIISVSILFASVLATLLFWDFRLAIAFLGIAVLLISKTIDVENVIRFSSLEVILFLVGMMVLVGLLKESGFFAWLVSLILRIRNLTATKFLISISIISALLACAVDEVTSIIFMTAAVLEICDYFEVNPMPFIITSVLTTNIGSAGTVLGNPIGILIASKSGLTFEDFIIKAFPIMLVCLIAATAVIYLWYRKPLRELDRKMKELGANDMLIKLISVPPERGLKISLAIFVSTILFIGLHHRLEVLWDLQPNTILLTVPLVSAGCVMIWRWKKARIYIEKDVEWWTLLFFMLLFAEAGTLKYTGATDLFAQRIFSIVSHNPSALKGVILWASAIGSSILDNVVLVAAFIPIVQSFQNMGFNLQPLWWALLFGGCLGGNITMVGSTANIVALGIMEKERGLKINFFHWLGIGLVVGMITTSIVWIFLSFMR